MFRGRKLATLRVALLVCRCTFAAIAAPLIAPFDPLEIDPIARLSEPGTPYLFGTDHFGRDSFSTRDLWRTDGGDLFGLGSVIVALVHGRA